MGPLRRRLNIIGWIAVLAGLSYCGYNFATAEKRVRAVCRQIQPGMTLAQLETFSRSHGLGPRPREGISYLVEAKTSGRHGCKVSVEKGVVKTSEYNYAD